MADLPTKIVGRFFFPQVLYWVLNTILHWVLTIVLDIVLNTEPGPAWLYNGNSKAPYEKAAFYAVNLHSPRSDQTGAGFKLTSP